LFHSVVNLVDDRSICIATDHECFARPINDQSGCTAIIAGMGVGESVGLSGGSRTILFGKAKLHK
jgi:hypothetical protein